LYDFMPTFVGYGADGRHLTPEEMKNILAANLFEKYCIGYHAGCSNCLEHCTYLWEVFVGPYAGTRTGALRFGSTDYMTMGMGNSNSASMVKFQSLVNQYGLCGKMMPTAMSFALELYERGILTKEHMTAFREGFGNILAEGPLNMARMIKGAYPYRHGAYGRRYTVALPYITGTRGTDHLNTSFFHYLPPETKTTLYESLSKKYPSLSPPNDPGVKGKGTWMVWEEDNKAVVDSIGRCQLPAGGIAGNNSILAEIEDDPLAEERAKLLSVLTGIELSTEEILKSGERIFNLERAFNIRQGARKELDMPPEHEQYIEADLLALTKVTPESMKEYFEDYYQARGWDVDTGIPTRAKLEELGLGYVADELEANMPYPSWEGPPLWPVGKKASGGKRAE
jgi:aldehyde:ferredoxin oxidoreductase